MKKIVIDMGSGVTKIAMPGCGVVLTEATCIAVEEYLDGGERTLGIKAYGDKARALSGRAAANTRIINPLFEGDIVHERLAAYLLEYFLNKIEITPRKAKRVQALFLLPCGLKSSIAQKYKRLTDECGIGSAYFAPVSFAAVLGHNVSISESIPMFSLDMGYSLTNFAVFSQDGLITGMNFNLGSGNIDAHIIDELAENRNFKIGGLTAEKVKINAGSLLPDDNKLFVADGREISSGAPASISVNSGQILNIIQAYVDKITEYIVMIMSQLPTEVTSGLTRYGIYLSGGFLKTDGLADYISGKLKIPVNVPEEPQLAAVIGGCVMISDEDMLDKLAYACD